jgi:hypothetical protein
MLAASGTRAMSIAPVLGILLALAAGMPAAAADAARRPRPAVQALAEPLALRGISRLAAAVRASDACWQHCQDRCRAAFRSCLARGPLAPCVAGTNACDLRCLRSCRLEGGPLVHWID